MIYQIDDFFKRAKNRLITKSMMKTFGSVGKKVSIMEGFYVRGNKNIFIADNVSIGPNATFLCTRAEIHIGQYVMMGPNVTIITGDHRMDIRGKNMMEVKEEEKNPENDQPVVLEGDNWIGANATILKGVTIGKGAVVSANALVIRDVEPYAIVGGIPAKKIKMRFDEDVLENDCKDGNK